MSGSMINHMTGRTEHLINRKDYDIFVYSTSIKPRIS